MGLKCFILLIGVLQQLGGIALCVFSGLAYLHFKNLWYVDRTALNTVCAVYFVLGVLICMFAGFVQGSAKRAKKNSGGLLVVSIILLVVVATKAVIIAKYDIWSIVGPQIDAGISPKMYMVNTVVADRGDLAELVFNREFTIRKIFITSFAIEALQLAAAGFLYLRYKFQTDKRSDDVRLLY